MDKNKTYAVMELHVNEMRSTDELMDGVVAQHISEILLWKLVSNQPLNKILKQS